MRLEGTFYSEREVQSFGYIAYKSCTADWHSLVLQQEDASKQSKDCNPSRSCQIPFRCLISRSSSCLRRMSTQRIAAGPNSHGIMHVTPQRENRNRHNLLFALQPLLTRPAP